MKANIELPIPPNAAVDGRGAAPILPPELSALRVDKKVNGDSFCLVDVSSLLLLLLVLVLLFLLYLLLLYLLILLMLRYTLNSLYLLKSLNESLHYY